MNTLWLKLVLTPSLIGAASLAGRKWGHAISGWLVALPLTTGPITFFLALSHGVSFAASAAAGTLAGGLAQAAFVLTYARLAQRSTWLPTLLAAILAFALITAALQQFTFALVPLWAAVLAAFFLTLRLLPRETEPEKVGRSNKPTVSKSDDSDSGMLMETLPGQWDIPLRMAIATGFVLLITGLAPTLGPRLTGLLAPFPVFTATLGAFVHHQHGPTAAVHLLRGLLMGLFSFASFVFTLALLLVPTGIPAAFATAILVVCVFQGVSLWLLRRRDGDARAQ